MTRIELEDGKYTLLSERGNLSALRYGEAWRNMTGDKLIGAMFDEIERLRSAAAEPAIYINENGELVSRVSREQVIAILGPILSALEEDQRRGFATLPAPQAAEPSEAYKDILAHLAGAASAYRTYADPKRGTPKDALFSTRADDFDKAVERGRAALAGRQQGGRG